MFASSISFRGGLLNCTGEKWIWFQGCPILHQNILAPIPKVQFFSHKMTRIFFGFVLTAYHLQAKPSITFILFYFIYWSNVMEWHTSIDWNLFFLVRHLIYFELVYVIRFVYDRFNFDQFCVISLSFQKKNIWVTKKIYAQNWFCYPFTKLKVNSIMAHRIDYIRWIWSLLESKFCGLNQNHLSLADIFFFCLFQRTTQFNGRP